MNLNERLEKGEKLICDGGMGTQLIGKGLQGGKCPELWNLEHPEKIAEIHKSYISSGADLITTNTFGGNLLKLKNFHLESKADEINQAGVNIARKSAEEKTFILGDIGPTGEFLKPLGTYSREEFYKIFHKQSESLAKAGADAIIIETMTDLGELTQAIKASKDTGLPIIASMAFTKDANRNNFHTMMGVDLKTFVNSAASTGADVISVNCGSGAEEILEIVKHLRKLTSFPLMAEPNAGLPRLIKGKTLYEQPPESFADTALKIFNAGANIVGGCCGTTPDHIRALFNLTKNAA
ncbi:MAG: homocysteine S-methyltransferase family protein [Candidatus Auribacterota bacterium]|nr:homocysteine S-methyltransferase family protein [Candidatus Auribacterota bacterium]